MFFFFFDSKLILDSFLKERNSELVNINDAFYNFLEENHQLVIIIKNYCMNRLSMGYFDFSEILTRREATKFKYDIQISNEKSNSNGILTSLIRSFPEEKFTNKKSKSIEDNNETYPISVEEITIRLNSIEKTIISGYTLSDEQVVLVIKWLVTCIENLLTAEHRIKLKTQKLTKARTALFLLICNIVVIDRENLADDKKDKAVLSVLTDSKSFFNIDNWDFDNNVFYNYDLIEIQVIQSVSDFISFINNQEAGNKYFFRGHARSDYQLIPSRLRYRDLEVKEFDHTQYLMKEKPDIVGINDYNIDVLVKMQHYGLSTRLLDVTENYAVALYFACEEEVNSSSNGEVIIFNVNSKEIKYRKSSRLNIIGAIPFLENEKIVKIRDGASNDNDGFVSIESFNNLDCVKDYLVGEVRKSLVSFETKIDPEQLFMDYFFYSNKSNQRVINQSGAFIVCGLYKERKEEISLRLLEQTLRNDKGRRMVFIVPSSKKKTILSELSAIGINSKFVYPEIEHVSKWIVNNI